MNLKKTLAIASFALAAPLVTLAQVKVDKHSTRLPDGQWRFTVERTIPVKFLGVVQPFTSWDSTQVFRNKAVRDQNGLIGEREDEEEGRRGHPTLDANPQPHGTDPAWQTTPATNGFDRAVDLSVNGIGNTAVSPADPCMAVGPNHVIQMINGSSGAYFRVCDKNLATIGAAQTYMDNFLAGVLSYSGLGDPVVLYDALADRWLMSEFTSNNNNLIVAISQTANPTGAWYAYSYTATNFPDYPKYAVWNNCYVVTTNENSPAIYALPRANMLAGTAGSAVRFTISSLASIGFQAAAPVHFSGGTAPPANAPAMFMRMVDDAWTAAADVDRLELWNINYNAATPASSTITGPTALNTAAFDSDLCGFTTLNCIQQPGAQTMDPIREILMNHVSYRNLGGLGYEAIVCAHSVDLNASDRACPRWYELHRTGGIANAWNIYQQGTFSPDANDRWMPTIAINNNGDIGLAYNIAGTTGGNLYPSVRYTGRYQSDPLGQMTFAETSIVAGTASNNSNRYGDYNSLEVDPTDGTSFYGTAMYNPAASWSTRMFKFSFPAVTNCTAPAAALSQQCLNATTFNLSVNLTSMGSATSVAIQVDNDGAGPNGFVTVQTVTATGNYGPFGPYNNTGINVRLVHNLDQACNVNYTGVTGNCSGPGALCVYSSTAPTTIVDQSTVTNTITVPSLGGQTITDLNVFVNITHTYVSDLRLTLTSPSGTSVPLVNTGICSNNQNMIVEFDQQASTAIGVTCPPTNIFAVPASTLNALNGQVMQGTWTLSVQDAAAQDAGTLNNWCLIPTLTSPNVQLAPKVFLEGPYNSGSSLMNDGLRSASLIPATQPFTALGYTFTGSPGAGGTVAGSVFATTGNNAIVDWVIVELRNPATPSTIVASCAALLQRDGDVVALDGTSPVSITTGAGGYYVAIRHRNHLGVMTAGTIALSGSAASVNFTSTATALYGTDPVSVVGGVNFLRTGDASFNKQLAYTGNGNDRDPILVRVGSLTPNNTVAGYYMEDTNLDGVVSYTGSGNDRDQILVNVGSTTPNNIRVEQLP